MRSNGFAVHNVRSIIVSATCALFALSIIAAPHRVHAAITVSGNTSTNPTAAGASPSIGINDIGRLTINAGSSVTSNTVVLGDLLAGIGLVTVTDFNAGTGSTSTWTTNNLYVGDAGTGRLEILAGGMVTVDFAGVPATGDFVVGNLVNSVGTVIVDGLGSMLRLGDDTVIGQLGTGTLRISNEGYVVGTNNAAGDTDIFTIGQIGRLELANGRLRTDVFANHGMITGSGRLDSNSALANHPTGNIVVNPGERLEINAMMDNGGNIAINGGEIRFLKSALDSGPHAEVTLRDGGIARFLTSGFGFDSLSGVLATTAGTNDIYGTVRIQTTASKISASGGSTAVFHDPVTNTGGTIEVFPGSTIVYLQGLTTTGSSASLAVALSDPETNPDGAIEVSGDASLAGNLNVSFAAGFKPTAGDVFPILSAAGAITGSLNLASAPALPGGMQWDLDMNTSSVLLSVVATGDYNGNGVVDTADYIVWRNSLNQQGSGLAADSNGDHIVNAADYEFWRSRIGNVIAPGLGGSAAIPEPATASLLLLTAAAVVLSHRRR
jgi:T5SS/PEP-CTERM-associated repeat protein